MKERKVSVTLEDDFGRVNTRIQSDKKLSDLMDEILELLEPEDYEELLNSWRTIKGKLFQGA